MVDVGLVLKERGGREELGGGGGLGGGVIVVWYGCWGLVNLSLQWVEGSGWYRGRGGER